MAKKKRVAINGIIIYSEQKKCGNFIIVICFFVLTNKHISLQANYDYSEFIHPNAHKWFQLKYSREHQRVDTLSNVRCPWYQSNDLLQMKKGRVWKKRSSYCISCWIRKGWTHRMLQNKSHQRPLLILLLTSSLFSFIHEDILNSLRL